MSLDRLINLAKRTGDRLIIHDPIRGRDLVILDIDSYEELVFDASLDVPTLDEMREETDWHSTGSILNDRYGAWDDHRSEPEAETIGAVPREEEGASLVDAMWESEKTGENEPKSEGIPADDKKPDDASDEPVFYEEPVL